MGPHDDDGRAFTFDALWAVPERPANTAATATSAPTNASRETFFFTLPPPTRLGTIRGRTLLCRASIPCSRTVFKWGLSSRGVAFCAVSVRANAPYHEGAGGGDGTADMIGSKPIALRG